MPGEKRRIFAGELDKWVPLVEPAVMPAGSHCCFLGGSRCLLELKNMNRSSIFATKLLDFELILQVLLRRLG
jgi:hypothetical protein